MMNFNVAPLKGLGIYLVALAITGCGPLPPDAFNDIAAKNYCEKSLKSLLRDPDSYQFISARILANEGEFDEYGTALIIYRSKNGFGGFVKGRAECTAYDNDGERWFEVKLM